MRALPALAALAITLGASPAGPQTISGEGLRLDLPSGWDGRVLCQAAARPCAVLQAASFGLPAGDAANALARMRPGDVWIRLAEVGNPPGRRFPPTRLPLKIGVVDFGGRAIGIPAGHAVAYRTFWTAGRSFVLSVDLAAKPPSRPLVREVNRLLATLVIRRTRPLVGPAGWRRLHRSLRLPRLEAGAACPRTVAGRSTPATAFGFGRGPAYAVVGTDGPVSLTGDRARAGASFHKTLWAIAPTYRGALLIRGARLAGSGIVRFHVGGPIRSELRLLPAEYGSRGWRYTPSNTMFPGPGCYGLQVDGSSFGETIVVSVTA